MAHNEQASGSGGDGGYTRPTNLNRDEAKILTDNNILVPPAWHLPHGRHVSAAGTPLPPFHRRGHCSMSTSSSATSPSGHRRAPFGSPSGRTCGSSSSAATTTPTTVGTTCPAVGHTSGGTTSTQCSGSTATAPSTVQRLRHVVRLALHPHRQQGRRRRAAPRKASPPCAAMLFRRDRHPGGPRRVFFGLAPHEEGAGGTTRRNPICGAPF
jgi:hypothetical protein